MRAIRHLIPLVLLLTVAGGARAQQLPSASALAAPEPPTIDGRLDEGAWARADVVGDFVQREPVEGRPVSERTEVRVMYDESALYIGAWLFDRTPGSIVFGQTLRDASLNEADAFVVVLDTYRDRQNGFVFATTPAGIEYDGQFTNEGEGGGGGGGLFGRQQAGSGGGFNLNWDGSWEVATSQDGGRWYAGPTPCRSIRKPVPCPRRSRFPLQMERPPTPFSIRLKTGTSSPRPGNYPPSLSSATTGNS